MWVLEKSGQGDKVSRRGVVPATRLWYEGSILPHGCPGLHTHAPVTVADMKKSVQWLTLQELRDELERTRLAWETDHADLGGVFADGQLPALGEDARRHHLVVNELPRQPSNG